MTDPKSEKRGAGFYAVILLAVLVLYIFSSGPVQAIVVVSENDRAIQAAELAYWPVRRFAEETGTEPWYYERLWWWIAAFKPKP
jgi:hypothetical protein